MKTLLFVCAATFSMASLGIAQETPQYEAFVGGSYLRVHASGSELTQLLSLQSVTYQPHDMNFNLYGWNASLVENVNHWLGGEIAANGFYGSPSASFLYPATQLVSPSPNFSKPVAVVTRYQNVLFGPRFTWRREGAVVLFAHVLAGVSHVNTSLNEDAVVATVFENLSAGPLKATTGLAVSPGAGIDLRLSSKLSIRAIQIDYLLTNAFGHRQDNALVSAGLDFTFGHK